MLLLITRNAKYYDLFIRCVFRKMFSIKDCAINSIVGNRCCFSTDIPFII